MSDGGRTGGADEAVGATGASSLMSTGPSSKKAFTDAFTSPPKAESSAFACANEAPVMSMKLCSCADAIMREEAETNGSQILYLSVGVSLYIYIYIYRILP